MSRESAVRVEELLTDEKLLRRMHANDPAAFSEMVARYQSRLSSLLWRMLGNKSDVEDSLQETYISFLSSVKDNAILDTAYPISSILYRRAFCQGQDVIRSRTRRKKHCQSVVSKPEDELSTSWAPVDSKATDPLLALLHSEELEGLRHAIAELPEKLSLPLKLRYVDDLTLRKISEVTGVPISTVKSRILQAMGILANRLGGLAPDLGT